MIVEIHGAGFQNKGAELMLRTVVHELNSRLSNFIPAIDPTYGIYESRSELRLRQIFPPRTHVGTPGFSQKLLQQKIFSALKINKLLEYFGGVKLTNYGCVNLAQLEALIDIAGFAYTDQWGSQPTIDFAELTNYYKAHHKPVILLPQAFGPFHQQETQAAFRKVVNNANLICPRDRQSYEYVMNLGADASQVMQVPDITLFYPDNYDKKIELKSDYVCIVPNCRMLAQGQQKWGDKYESHLIKIAKEILLQGLKVCLVIHDSSGEDLKLAQSLYHQVASSEVNIITESSPLALKELIGNSMLLIGSRYHSLVASLSKKVPAIALGWSHKYEMLFQDFGCEQFLVSHDTSIDKIFELVQKLIYRENNLYYRKQIAEKLEGMRQNNQKMWKRVIQILEEKKN